jgi:ribosome assembly protein 3
MEFQEDLDKIRSSADFKDGSIPILVNALRQGQSLFSEDEKNGIMGKGGKPDA